MNIRYYCNVQDMTGLGEEWLFTKDFVYVIAKFYNGQMEVELPSGNLEITKVIK